MRLFWTGVLLTGLVLIGVSTYERQAASDEGGGGVTMSKAEDGTPFPQPYPTPTPK
jgi:hypothetical protein